MLVLSLQKSIERDNGILPIVKSSAEEILSKQGANPLLLIEQTLASIKTKLDGSIN